MHMICLSMLISASTVLTEFWYILCLKEITAPVFRRPLLCWCPEAYAPCSFYPQPLRMSYLNQTSKFGLLGSCYAITYKMNFRFAESIQCCSVTK